MNGLPLPDPPLTDGVVRLRPWLEADVDTIVAAGHDPVIPEMTTVVRGGTLGDAHTFIARQHTRTAGGSGIPLAIAEAGGGRAVGWIGANRPDLANRRADIGYWVLAAARGRGLAARATALFVPWLVETLGLVRVEAVVAPDNHASRRVVEGLGFEREGLLRAYMVFPAGLWRGAGPHDEPVSHDMLMYARVSPPADPGASQVAAG